MKKSVFVILMFMAGICQMGNAQDAYIAEIRLFAGNFAPQGWMFCDGTTLPINQYTALFAPIGTYYGGNGTTTFALPDLRGRVPVHVGNGLAGPGLSSYQLGEKGGAETVNLTTLNMPAHNHVQTMAATNQIADTNNPQGAVLAIAHLPNTGEDVYIYKSNAAGNLAMSSAATMSSGSSLPFKIVQPYLGMNYIICTNGIFPSRP